MTLENKIHCVPDNRCSDMISLLTSAKWIKLVIFSSAFLVIISAMVGGTFTALTHFEEAKQTRLLQGQKNFISEQKTFISEQKDFNTKVLSAMEGFAQSLNNLTDLIYKESRRNDVQDYYMELNRVNDNQVRGELGMKKVTTKPVPLPTYEDMKSRKRKQ